MYNKAYYEANKIELRQNQNAYKIANRAVLRDKQRIYATTNSSAISEYKKAYYQIKKEELRAICDDALIERKRAFITV